MREIDTRGVIWPYICNSIIVYFIFLTYNNNSLLTLLADNITE